MFKTEMNATHGVLSFVNHIYSLLYYSSITTYYTHIYLLHKVIGTFSLIENSSTVQTLHSLA